MQKEKHGKGALLFLAQLLVVLALLPGCFRREELVDAFGGGDIPEPTAQAGEDVQFCGPGLMLGPGVYRIRIQTDLAEGQNMYVQMKCGLESFKALRNNGMVIFPGNDGADFEVYVLDKVETAYVQCDFHNVDVSGLVRLEVWKTNLGNRMLLFVLAVCFGVWDFLAVFRRRILEGKVSVRQQVVFWTLAAGVLLACFPLLTDYIIGGDDLGFHLGRIAFLADALKDGGTFPVRVEGEWLYGHGYASPLFYGDFFLYIAAFLRLTGFSIMASYKMFLVLVTAATAAIGYFCIRRCLKDEYAALFGSMVYLLSPYRLYNVYGRAAVGEYLGMTFLLPVCCGMYLLYKEDVEAKDYKNYKWYVVLGMSAVLQSHLVTTELAAFIMLVVCAVFWKRTFRRRTFLQLAQATGIVLLANAWFWCPMLYMMKQDVYHMRMLTESDVQLSGIVFGNFLHLLPYGKYRYEARNDILIGAGMVSMLLLYALWRAGRKGKEGACDFFAVSGVLALALSTRYFPWNLVIKLPVIGFAAASLQFPWRWMSPATVFFAMFAAVFYLRVRDGGGAAKIALGAGALITVASAVYHVNIIAFEGGPLYLYNMENMGTIMVQSGEYLLEESVVSEFSYHDPVAEEGLVWGDYEKSGTNVTLTLENASRGTRYIEIPLTGYKGYGVRTTDAEGEAPYIAGERGAHGDLRLAVPAGYRGSVEIYYKGAVLFWVAEIVSAATILSVLLYCLARYAFVSITHNNYHYVS